MTQPTLSKKDTLTYLIYGAIALLILNFILLFLPFLESYQPSYSKTVLGVTTYEGWYTQSAPIVLFIFPVFFTGIPYLCSIISIFNSFRKKNNKNSFLKIKNNAVVKPIKFFWLKFAAIANALTMWMIYSTSQSVVGSLKEHGAYCRITFWGVMNILCTLAFIVVLFILSSKTKSMFTLVNKTNVLTPDTQQEAGDEMKESEQ